MEDFFPSLQNPADTGFHFGSDLPYRRHARATIGGPSPHLPFELSNEYINRALHQRLGPVLSEDCKILRLDLA
jgi:hypothetical protein